MTGDRDMYQCAGERVSVLLLKSGTSGFEEVGPAEVRKRYGVGPELVPDFIALRGDPSDGLPGAPGIGPKTAADLLDKYGSLEGAIAKAWQERPRVTAALTEGADELRAFRDIATLRTHRCRASQPIARPISPAGRRRRASYGMNRLAERLEKAGSVSDCSRRAGG